MILDYLGVIFDYFVNPHKYQATAKVAQMLGCSKSKVRKLWRTEQLDKELIKKLFPIISSSPEEDPNFDGDVMSSSGIYDVLKENSNEQSES